MIKNIISNFLRKKNKEHFFNTFPFLKSLFSYEYIMRKDYEDISDLEKELVMYYIGILCSIYVENHYLIRVKSLDIERHLKKEIDIFELQEHIYSPSKDSPEEIYLGGITWRLDYERMEYYEIMKDGSLLYISRNMQD